MNGGDSPPKVGYVRFEPLIEKLVSYLAFKDSEQNIEFWVWEGGISNSCRNAVITRSF